MLKMLTFNDPQQLLILSGENDDDPIEKNDLAKKQME